MTTGPIPFNEWQALELGTLDVSLFRRCYGGDAAPAEVAQLDAWLAVKPGRRAWCDQFWQGLTAPDGGRELSPQEVTRRTSAVLRAIETGSIQAPAPTRHIDAPRPHVLRTAAQIGVGLVAVVIVAVLGYSALQQRGKPTASDARTYATTTGQIAVVRLSDGTQVTLGPRSQLRVPTFGSSARTVVLTGEANFEVAHSGGAPFVVQAGDVNARVLGTTFTVRNYGARHRVVVAVSDGKVAVNLNSVPRPAVTLTAGTAGVASDSAIVTTSVIEGTQYTGWMRGYLVFRKAPISEVLESLSRWYGYEFRLTDSSMTTLPTTIALSTKSPAAALSTLKLVLDVDLSFNGDVVTIRPRHTQAKSTKDRRNLREFQGSPTQVGR